MKTIKRKLVEMPDELFKNVQRVAKKSERSVNKQIIFMLRDFFDKKNQIKSFDIKQTKMQRMWCDIPKNQTIAKRLFSKMWHFTIKKTT